MKFKIGAIRSGDMTFEVGQVYRGTEPEGDVYTLVTAKTREGGMFYQIGGEAPFYTPPDPAWQYVGRLVKVDTGTLLPALVKYVFTPANDTPAIEIEVPHKGTWQDTLHLAFKNLLRHLEVLRVEDEVARQSAQKELDDYVRTDGDSDGGSDG